MTDSVLAAAFSKYSSYQRAKVVRFSHNNKTKGYGFVSLMDPEEGAKCLREMNGKYIGEEGWGGGADCIALYDCFALFTCAYRRLGVMGQSPQLVVGRGAGSEGRGRGAGVVSATHPLGMLEWVSLPTAQPTSAPKSERRCRACVLAGNRPCSLKRSDWDERNVVDRRTGKAKKREVVVKGPHRPKKRPHTGGEGRGGGFLHR